MRDVRSRDMAVAVFGAVSEHIVVPAAPAVGQRRRSDDRPVEPAGADKLLLPVFVGVNAAETKREVNVVIPEAAHAPAITGAKAGDGEETPDAARLHCS